VSSGGSSTLTWTSANATDCTASDGWSGAKGVSASQRLADLKATQRYTLTCTGPGGSATASATIGVDEPVPTVTLEATPQTAILGQSVALTWTATNVAGCTVSGGWSGARDLSGSELIVKPAQTQTYSIACTGLGGTARAALPVDVFPPPEAPSHLAAAVGDGAITVSWASHAGSFHAGQLVSTNLYVSTRPGIKPATFVEAGSDQVRRGLETMASIVFSGFSNSVPLYVVATDVAGGIEGPPSVEITVTPQVIPALVERMDALNDTGASGCTDRVLASTSCPQPALPNQDGDVGRDAAASAGRLAKIGFGLAGFDFTKLNETGAALPNNAPAWSCIHDNVTGLTWQVPTESGLTGYQNVYTWHHPDPALNGGYPGLPNGGVCVGSACDTEAFIRALNQAGWCGYSDWRLPTRRELFSLANFAPLTRPFDAQAFPLQPPASNGFYWTSTVASFAGSTAWAMHIAGGLLEVIPKTQFRLELSLGYVLAVR
jgi:hypothetical protein